MIDNLEQLLSRILMKWKNYIIKIFFDENSTSHEKEINGSLKRYFKQ